MNSSTLGNELINIFGNASIGTAVNQSQDDESDYSDAPNSSNVSKFEGAAISICCSDGAEKNHLSCLSFICFSHFERPRKFV